MEEAEDIRTDFLFPKRNFMTGVASILSISGDTAEFNASKSGDEADCKAIKSDWEMIGKDLKKVIIELAK